MALDRRRAFIEEPRTPSPGRTNLAAPDAQPTAEGRLHPPRYKLWSSPHFRLDETGAVCFLPEEALRAVSLLDHEVEFDVSYRTNNLGLIDHGGAVTTGVEDEQALALAVVDAAKLAARAHRCGADPQ